MRVCNRKQQRIRAKKARKHPSDADWQRAAWLVKMISQGQNGLKSICIYSPIISLELNDPGSTPQKSTSFLYSRCFIPWVNTQ